MLCGISGETPTDPVVSTKTGVVFERRLIEQYIKEHGKEPGTDHDLAVEDLLPVKTSRVVPPRLPKLTSIPSLLGVFQNEWDALALETYRLQQELAKTRQEISTALYQNDAAVRVIARLTRERNEARDALSRISVSAGSGSGGGGGGGGDAMAIDTVEGLPEDIAAKVTQTLETLSKSRKKRPIPQDWVTPEDVSAFAESASTTLPGSGTVATLAVEGDHAAVSGARDDTVVYSIEANVIERQFSVGEPVLASAWAGSRIILATAGGSVKVFDDGNEVASFTEHAGPVAALSVHPCGTLLASAGRDKGLVLYDLETNRRVGRCYAESDITSCAFHPDGHLIGLGTSSGDVHVYATNSLTLATTYPLGAPVQALEFSENGFWLGAAARDQTTVTVFDLRKQDGAAVARVLDTGGTVRALAWDYTGQFLATAGPQGVAVQQYQKATKRWFEPFRAGTEEPAVGVKWGENGRRLLCVGEKGTLTVYGVKAD